MTFAARRVLCHSTCTCQCRVFIWMACVQATAVVDCLWEVVQLSLLKVSCL